MISVNHGPADTSRGSELGDTAHKGSACGTLERNLLPDMAAAISELCGTLLGRPCMCDDNGSCCDWFGFAD